MSDILFSNQLGDCEENFANGNLNRSMSPLQNSSFLTDKFTWNLKKFKTKLLKLSLKHGYGFEIIMH